jgi:hypothetical protein
MKDHGIILAVSNRKEQQFGRVNLKNFPVPTVSLPYCPTWFILIDISGVNF